MLGIKTGACFDLNFPFLISLLVQRLSTQLTYCSLLKEYAQLLLPGRWSEKTCSCSLGQAAFWLALGYSRGGGLGGGGREATGFIGTSRSQLVGWLKGLHPAGSQPPGGGWPSWRRVPFQSDPS